MSAGSYNGRAPVHGVTGPTLGVREGGASLRAALTGREGSIQGQGDWVAPGKPTLVNALEVGGSNPSLRFAPERLYFVTRADLSEGRRIAQAIHVMDQWCLVYGPQQGTVIVYEVPDESDLLLVWDHVLNQSDGKAVCFREPDLGNEMTALATSLGRLDLPLLGSGRK